MVSRIGTLNQFENELMFLGVYYSQTMVGCCGDEIFEWSLVGGYNGMNCMNHLSYKQFWWLCMVVGE